MYASMALVALTVIYDELGTHAGHWAVRNLVNASASSPLKSAPPWSQVSFIIIFHYATSAVSLMVIQGNNRHYLDNTARLSVLCSAGIFFTTIQSQDFKDVEGDSLIGRQTIPIVHPKLAAPTLAMVLRGMVRWSCNPLACESRDGNGNKTLLLWVSVYVSYFRGRVRHISIPSISTT